MRAITTSPKGQSPDLSGILFTVALNGITREASLQNKGRVGRIYTSHSKLPEFSVSASTRGLRSRRGDEAILTGIGIAQTIYRLQNDQPPPTPPKDPGKGPPEHDPEQLRRELAEDKEDRDSLYRR